MIVTYIHSNHPEDSCRVRLRCRNFADAINRIGWHSANLLDVDSFIQNTPEANRLCTGSDLLIIHRYLYGPMLQAIAYWKARDKKVIVDLDQAINYLTTDIPSSSLWLEGVPSKEDIDGGRGSRTSMDSTRLEQFKWGLGLIDAAMVSSTHLLMDWSNFTDIYEVPDYINTDQYPAFKQVHEHETWIGMASNTRLESIRNSGLSQALENVCRERPEVKLVVCHFMADAGQMLNIQPSQLVLYSPNSFEEWADILLKLDIGLVPIHGDYDLRLGRINLLEFMISKTPWIASNQHWSRELSRYGRLVPNLVDAWESAILKVVDHLEISQKRAAGEPFLFALSQDVNENIDKVLRLYAHILHQVQRSGAR